MRSVKYKLMIPYASQDISKEDIECVADVLRSSHLTQGQYVTDFEKAVSLYCGVKFAVAVNSATSALHISLLALGIGKGDIVWTVPNSFVASANAVLHCGATVDFVDIDPVSRNICVTSLQEKLKKLNHNGKIPKALICVHFAGESCDMETVKKIVQPYGIKIVEDASHAVGGSYINSPVGSCTYSDVTVFSFHPVKIITTGEGGMALTNDSHVQKRLFDLRSHGVTRDKARFIGENQGDWYYEQQSLGYNYRMTDIQAALGISQLSRLKKFVNKRHKIANIYNKAFSTLPIKLPYFSNNSALHLYSIEMSDKEERKRLFEHLRKNGVLVNVHYIPIHTQPFYLRLGFKHGDFPNSERYYDRCISLPLYPALEREQQAKVIKLILDFYK